VSGGGVVSTMEAMAIHRGRLRRRVPLAGVAATSVALGTGASGGREGPIVLFGGAVGSLVAGLGRMDEDRTRALVAAGVAAGIAASFNAPIGGMLFAIELLLGGLQARRCAPDHRRRRGRLVRHRPPARRPRPAALPARTQRTPRRPDGAPRLRAPRTARADRGGGLPLRRGLAGRLFSRVRVRVGVPLTVALGGLVVGLTALVVPEVLGEGADLPNVPGASREPIRAMLDGLLGSGWPVAVTLLILLVAKLFASVVTIASGSAVGTFAPSLFTGAALGGAVGAVAVEVLGVRSATGFALVGMAAVFTALVRAPLTAIILVFELSGDYELVLPLMIAVGIATFGAERLGWRSIYVEGLRRRGVTLDRPDDVDVLQLVAVREVMTRADAPNATVPASLPVDELRRRFAAESLHGAVVVAADGTLVGVVARSDLDREVPEPSSATAADIATRRPASAVPEEPVFRAVQRMANLDVGRLPVVDPATGRVVGVFRRADVVRAYDRGIERTVSERLARDAGRLRDVTGLEAVRLVVAAGSAVDGAAVREVRWPERTILTGIQRGTEAIVPGGDTAMHADDVVVALTGDADALRDLLRRPVATGQLDDEEAGP
jgi:chloride channel protein, CIC family